MRITGAPSCGALPVVKLVRMPRRRMRHADASKATGALARRKEGSALAAKPTVAGYPNPQPQEAP